MPDGADSFVAHWLAWFLLMPSVPFSIVAGISGIR
jgi:hypothetical protein